MFYHLGDVFDRQIRDLFREFFAKTLMPIVEASNGNGHSKRRSRPSSASLKPLVTFRGQMPSSQYTALLGQLTRKVYDFLCTYSPPNLPRNYPARTAWEYAIHEARSYCRRYPNQGLIEDGDLLPIVYLVLADCVEHYDFSRRNRAGFMTYLITSVRNRLNKMYGEEQPALPIDQQADPDDGEAINPERFLVRAEEQRSRVAI